MTRNRVVTALVLVGLLGVGVTVLVAARSPNDKIAGPPKPQAAPLKKLVCLGHVDTEDRMIGIFPDNYPQPSQVLKVLVREGEEVKKDQPLLELDRRMLDLKVTEAEAGIVEANGKLAQAQATIRNHRNTIDVLEQELLAKEAELEAKKRVLEQTERAVAGERKSLVELEVPKAEVKAAGLTLLAARKKWETAKAEVPTYWEDLANAGITRAKELKRQAERARDQVACTAKADGRIIRTFVSEGSSFGPTTREPAFWFVKKGPLVVRAEVSQEFAGRVAKGQTVTIEDETDDKQQWAGRVTKVGDQFLQKRQGSGSAIDIFPVNDERVLECLLSIDLAAGQTGPRFGQKVRIKIDP